MKKVSILLSVTIETDKPAAELQYAITKGIIWGLDTKRIARPNDISVDYIENTEPHIIEKPLLQDSTDIELIRFDPSQVINYIIMSVEEFCDSCVYDIEDILNFFGDNNGDFIATKTFTLPFFCCEFEGNIYFIHMGNDADTSQILSAFENGESQDETDFSINVFDGNICVYDTYFFNI